MLGGKFLYLMEGTLENYIIPEMMYCWGSATDR